MKHVKVIPGAEPVRIYPGPTIQTNGKDRCDWFISDDGIAEIIVGGTKVVEITRPWPEPVKIPGTPYEAYTFGSWFVGEFAIRLREDKP